MKKIKYIFKLLIAYPTAIVLGIFGANKLFVKLLNWLNKE